MATDDILLEQRRACIMESDDKKRTAGLAQIDTLRRKNYLREKRCVDRHLELVLSFSEYVRLNRYMRQEGAAALKKEQELLTAQLDGCGRDEARYPMAKVVAAAADALVDMWALMDCDRG